MLEQLRTWVSENYRDSLADFDECLNAPATEATVAELESGLGCTLPDAVRRDLLAADGMNCHPELSRWKMLSTSQILGYSRGMRGETIYDGLIDPHPWRDYWIPLYTDHGGDAICLNLAIDDDSADGPDGLPDHGGLFRYCHEENRVEYEAGSLDAWFELWVEDIPEFIS